MGGKGNKLWNTQNHFCLPLWNKAGDLPWKQEPSQVASYKAKSSHPGQLRFCWRMIPEGRGCRHEDGRCGKMWKGCETWVIDMVAVTSHLEETRRKVVFEKGTHIHSVSPWWLAIFSCRVWQGSGIWNWMHLEYELQTMCMESHLDSPRVGQTSCDSDNKID